MRIPDLRPWLINAAAEGARPFPLFRAPGLTPWAALFRRLAAYVQGRLSQLRLRQGDAREGHFFSSASQFSTNVMGGEVPCSTCSMRRIRPSGAVSSGPKLAVAIDFSHAAPAQRRDDFTGTELGFGDLGPSVRAIIVRRGKLV